MDKYCIIYTLISIKWRRRKGCQLYKAVEVIGVGVQPQHLFILLCMPHEMVPSTNLHRMMGSIVWLCFWSLLTCNLMYCLNVKFSRSTTELFEFLFVPISSRSILWTLKFGNKNFPCSSLTFKEFWNLDSNLRSKNSADMAQNSVKSKHSYPPSIREMDAKTSPYKHCEAIFQWEEE